MLDHASRVNPLIFSDRVLYYISTSYYKLLYFWILLRISSAPITATWLTRSTFYLSCQSSILRICFLLYTASFSILYPLPLMQDHGSRVVPFIFPVRVVYYTSASSYIYSLIFSSSLLYPLPPMQEHGSRVVPFIFPVRVLYYISTSYYILLSFLILPLLSSAPDAGSCLTRKPPYLF